MKNLISTHSQKAQKVESLPTSPDVATGHRWRDFSVCPVALLDELIAGGATLSEAGIAFDERALDAVRDQKTALLALWRFREYGFLRVRHKHWICPDARLLTLWREAEAACRTRLTIGGKRAKTQKSL